MTEPTTYILIDPDDITIDVSGGRLLLVFKGLAARAGFVDGSEVAVELSAPNARGLVAAIEQQLRFASAQAEPLSTDTVDPLAQPPASIQ